MPVRLASCTQVSLQPLCCSYTWSHNSPLTLLRVCSSGHQHACCYCFRKGLIRKAHLCHNTKKWAAKHPEGWLAKSVPEAFIFELDDIDYIEEALCDVPEVCSSQAACPEFG